MMTYVYGCVVFAPVCLFSAGSYSLCASDVGCAFFIKIYIKETEWNIFIKYFTDFTEKTKES